MSNQLRKIWENQQPIQLYSIDATDKQKLFREVMALVMQWKPKDGYTPRKGIDYVDGKTPSKEELVAIISKLQPTKKQLIDLIETLLPTKAQLKEIIQPMIPAKAPAPTEEELLKLMRPFLEEIKAMVPSLVNNVKPTPEEITALIDPVMRRMVDEAKKGWFGGGGGGDLVGAGTGITITTNNIGRKIISATGSGSGANVATEELTATQVGNNVTLNLTQLANTYISIQFISKDGQIVTPGLTGWTQSGDTITVFNASADQDYLVNYTF